MISRRDNRLNLEQTKRLSKARVLGSGTALPILLEDAELAKLISVILSDTENLHVEQSLPKLPVEADGDYYKIPLTWFEEGFDPVDIVGLFLNSVKHIRDFDTYFYYLELFYYK